MIPQAGRISCDNFGNLSVRFNNYINKHINTTISSCQSEFSQDEEDKEMMNKEDIYEEYKKEFSNKEEFDKKTKYFITLKEKERIKYIERGIKKQCPHKKIELFRIIHEKLLQENTNKSVAFQGQDREESFDKFINNLPKDFMDNTPATAQPMHIDRPLSSNIHNTPLNLPR